MTYISGVRPVLQQRKYRDIGDKPTGVQVSLDPTTREIGPWVLRKQH